MIRPEVREALIRWQEVWISGLIALFGIWVGTRGGYLLGPVGILLVLVGLGLGWSGFQRLRFTSTGEGPGIVEALEGEIRWFGPGIGGSVAVRELEAVGLITVQGLRVWRLVQGDGAVLLIPINAKGIELLFDALTSLPGLEAPRLIRALDMGLDTPFVWRRGAHLSLDGAGRSDTLS